MQIYLMNTDGSGQTRLTYSDGNDDCPRWSPNGAKILFQSDRDHPDTGYMDIYVMNSDGSGVTRLTTDANDSAAVWEPNGSRIAFQSLRNGSYYQIYAMNSVGHGQVNLSNSSANDSQPSWSPDGTKIAFASDRDQAGFSSIYVMDTFGGSQTRLTFSAGGVRDEQPAWSPDGSKVAFTSTRDSIVVTWQETDDDGGIVTKSELHVNNEIYVMNSDGTNQIRLTNDLGNNDSPDWSPDGTKIIFRSDRERDWSDPTSQVWIMNPDGSNQTNLSSSGNGDYSASWASNAANQSPVANAGGPYNGFTAQAVNFNGGSFDPDGTITSYSWDFGDGVTSASPASSHAYATAGTYSVTLTVTDNLGAQASGTTTATITSGGQSGSSDGSSSSPDATARPVTISFDTVSTNIILSPNQYPMARFSTNTQFGANIWTINDGGVGGSPPNGIESVIKYLSAIYNNDVYVNFATPVNGLTFRVLDGVVPNDFTRFSLSVT
jgi:TolB protein